MKIFSKIKVCFIIILVGFCFSQYVDAATLELNLEKDITSTKDDVVVLLTINSEEQEINTAQAVISFPTNLLEVTNIDLNNSIFTFWLENPSFDNSKGEIIFAGGATSGFNGPALKLMRISFKVKGSGSGQLSINNGAITASDGTGSNVYNTSKGLNITIPTSAEFQSVILEREKQVVAIEQAKKLAVPAKKLPVKPEINIPFYPDQTKWNNNSASFKVSWNINPDINEAGISLDKNPNSIPPASIDALSGSKVFQALSDGVWYLHLRLKNNIGWSPILNYRIAIDTTPPSIFKIILDSGSQTNNPRPTISFSSSDITSGINNYLIRLDGAIATSTNMTSYKFSPLLPGAHSITVVAVDSADNSTSENQIIDILPISSPVITYVSRSVIASEDSITAGGVATSGVEILVQLQNNQKQIVYEEVFPINTNGNWNITINKDLKFGEYNLIVRSRDENMASSFPVTSETIIVKPRPVLAIGWLEIDQTSFFTGLILVLLCSFASGWYTYRNWRNQLGKRVTIAQRDVINFFDNLISAIDELLHKYATDDFDKANIAEIRNNLKKMKETLEKSRRYIIENIREINN